MTQSYAYGPSGPLPPALDPPRRRTGVWGILATVLLVLSAVANAVLVLVVIALVAAVAGSYQGEPMLERVIEPGPRSAKIAVIGIQGVVDEEMASLVARQVDRAAKDGHVVAVILRISSPGGGLTASDEVYHTVKTHLSDTGKPVVAAMGSVAASGGYYIACAADRIVAQPTTITGSIGVIAQFFYLNTLMTEKLGIQPVTLKMGDQKDWPNIFSDVGMTEEQQKYLMDSLMVPGYERFVSIVADARGMERGRVLGLATGRIFLAAEAAEAGLVDEIGYFERAVEVAKEEAGVASAQVVEYRKPFELQDLFGLAGRAKAALDLGPEDLAALGTPRVMYLWAGQ